MMHSNVMYALLFLVITFPNTEMARILAVTPISFVSHHMIIQPILRTLVDAGHELVVFTSYASKQSHPNYTEIILDTVPTDNSNVNEIILQMISNPYWKCLDNMLHIHDQLIKGTLENENIKRLLNSNEKFDLVITESYLAQEFTFMFGHKFEAPTIGMQTFFANCLINYHTGNSLLLTSMPEACFPHSNKMTFLERFMNAFSILRGMYIYKYHHLPTVERKMRKYFPDMPPLQDLNNNISLMFINDHMTADYAQPRPPTIVSVAGIHIEPEKPLPQDIKRFMDEAKHGVILMSLGTLVPDEIRPKKFFDSLIKVFRKLPQRVIWKTRKANIEGLPENVMLVQWMPQRDVLAHPNCVLFITHGGLASQHETIYNGVPVIGIPYFSDQYRNVEFYVAKEVGIRVFPNEISEETMAAAISSVLKNPKYRDNMRKLSRIFRDTPMTPKQAVVYWTEYVLRHRGAPHLKPAVVDLSWYQRALLDVLLLVVLVVILVVSALYLMGRTIYKSACSSRNAMLVSDKKLH